MEVEVSHWPQEIPVDSVGVGETSLDMLKAFRAWAHAHGCSLPPAVDTWRPYSWITAEQYAAVTLPMMLLAVSDGDDIAGVYLHVDGDDVMTVEDGIEELRDCCADGALEGNIVLASSD